MLKFVIIDDEKTQLDLTCKLIHDWAKTDIDIEIFTFDSAESFLFNHKNSIDIFILDIQMRGINGIALARYIREKDERAQIIFVTGFDDFMNEGYDVSALHYLIKPIKKEKLFETLDRAVKKLNEEPRSILFKKAGGDIRIITDDILYCEVLSHTITIYLKSGQENINMSIADMEVALGDDFFRCHRSFIVSLKHVCRVTKNAMIVKIAADIKKEIPLSRKLYENANQAFINFN